MIKYFLNEQEGMTERKRKIINKRFLQHRKYNPFHLDCQYTRRKLCYCKKHPIEAMTDAQKRYLWATSYQAPALFYEERADQQK